MIALTNRIGFSTDRAESSYGVPVLLIDGQAFGAGDVYGPALRAALDNPADELNFLLGAYTGYQLLLNLCANPDAKEALDAFCPPNWGMPNGEAA